MRQLTPIDIILKDPKGKIFEEGNLRGGQINVTTWNISNDVLSFKAKFSIKKDNPDTTAKNKTIKVPAGEEKEILLEEILFLAIHGRVIFPIEEEEE